MQGFSRGSRAGRWRGSLGGTGLLLAGMAVLLGCSERWGHSSAVSQASAPSPAESSRRFETRLPLQILLHDVTDETGITFVHTHGGTGERYVFEPMTGGLALFDYDGDGDEDIYFLNGAPLPLGSGAPLPLGSVDARPAPTNALLRNDGDWKFTDLTAETGLDDTGYGMGVAVGDYDNDGDPDLYVNNFGPNVLYRNNGDGTFTDVTTKAGVADGNKVGAGACFFDMDGDGDLDLYSANYVKFSYQSNPKRFIGGYPRYPSPLDFSPDPDTLFRNDGDGTFTDVSLPSGIGLYAGSGMGVTACDYDNDADLDLFVCNDVRANFFFQNDGNGKFEEVGLMIGVAYNFMGKANGSMGVDCADYDNDGWFDFIMTSFQAEMPALYRNLGGGVFEDVALKTGLGTSCLPHVNWGTGFVDFDNDGDRDVFIANGHLQPLIDHIDETTAYRPANALFLNTGDGEFVDVSDSAGDGMLVKTSSRGTAFGDLDNDGDLDAVVLNSQDKPTLLRNDTDNGNHWIQLRLHGVETNRDGIGARVTLAAGDLVQIDEVHSGRGYQSHYGTRLHFGLGQRDRVDSIEVRWSGGGTELLEDVAVDQLLSITEAKGAAPTP